VKANRFHPYIMSISNRLSWSRNIVQTESGLGLAELLVAIAILGIAATTLAVALSTGSMSVREAEQETIAQQLAGAQLELIKGANYDSTGTSYPTVSAPGDYVVSYQANSGIYADTDIQGITVTVSRGTTEVLTIEGYKVNR
jgi:type II secretory pathway pseudopilin PulG